MYTCTRKDIHINLKKFTGTYHTKIKTFHMYLCSIRLLLEVLPYEILWGF